ncbi:MAG: hypothetical protein QXX79_06120 [Candidatus Bathyarchaeia archaeon]
MNLIPIMTLFLGVLTFIIVMLLPAIIELKRPKDPGPRIILEKTPYLANFQPMLGLPPLEAYETIKIDPESIGRLAKVLAALPVLDV